jgi:hypothetical protein
MEESEGAQNEDNFLASNSMILYTWNVLNPAFAAMTWLDFADKKTGAALAKKDQARTPERQAAILAVLRKWLATPAVVCLQEVWSSLREALQKEYGKNAAFTTDNDDCRATIVKGLTIVRATTHKFPFDPPKSALIATILMGRRRVRVLNLHLHWKWNDAEAIFKHLYKLPTFDVIAGDCNKRVDEVSLPGMPARLKGVTGVHPTDGVLAAIDQVRVGPNVTLKGATIVDNLIYDFKRVLQKGFRDTDLSDHAPVKATIMFPMSFTERTFRKNLKTKKV